MKKVINTITHLSTWLKTLLSLLLGFIASFSMAPYNFWFLLTIGLSFLYLLLHSAKNKKHLFIFSYSFFLGFFILSLWWIGNALLVEGNDYAWGWPLAIIGLPSVLALFPATCITLITKNKPLNHLQGFVSFIAAVCLAEWLRGNLFTGFPWNLFGYSWANNLYVFQSLSVGGIYFLSLFSVLWFSFLGFILIWETTLRKKCALSLICIFSFLIIYGYGFIRINNYTPSFHKDTQIRLVQANIPQNEKWESEFFFKNLNKNIALSTFDNNEIEKQKIIIWPETSITYYHLENKQSQSLIQNMLKDNKILISGMLNKDNKGFMNSISLISSDLKIENAYHKSHLVPFGEYIPFQSWIPIKPVTEFVGFKEGKGPEIISYKNIPDYTALVCYEIIFPGKVTKKDKRPQWIINATNDAWYGISPGPYQHLMLAVARAIEEGLPIARAANTGISAVILPTGHLYKKIDLQKSGYIDTPIPKPLPPTLYSKFANIPYLITLLTLLLYIYVKRKR
jgi:apolipoprotein N-acyltransferase